LTRAAPRKTLDLGLLDRMMVALNVITPLEGIIFGADVGWRWCCSGGNPRSGSPWRCVMLLFLPGHCFSSGRWLEVALRWRGVPLPMSTTVGLGGMVPRSLDGGHGMRCVHRKEAPSGTMVVPSAESRIFMRILTIKIAQRFDGGDDTSSVYMRCSLSFC
jgi:hypothetical protein